jgi:hypothetical protein
MAGTDRANHQNTNGALWHGRPTKSTYHRLGFVRVGRTKGYWRDIERYNRRISRGISKPNNRA